MNTKLVVFFLALGATAALGVSYTAESRRAAIASALTELRRDSEGAIALRDAIRISGRSRCRGNANALVVRCYLEVARESCAESTSACISLADVIVTNYLGDDSFLADSDRYALMNASDDFRAALDDELDRRYGALAAELALASSQSVDAAVIDAFCTTRARSTRLPWHRCVAALVWFIGREQAE